MEANINTKASRASISSDAHDCTCTEDQRQERPSAPDSYETYDLKFRVQTKYKVAHVFCADLCKMQDRIHLAIVRLNGVYSCLPS